MASSVTRPKTPDLNDLRIPCVNSVKHLIAELGENDVTTKPAINPHLMEVLTENPTDDLDLLKRSLENLQSQEGVPEYDDILSVTNDFVESSDEEVGSSVARRGKGGGGLDEFLASPTSKGRSSSFDDSISLGSASISQLSHTSASVTLNGKTFFSLIPETAATMPVGSMDSIGSMAAGSVSSQTYSSSMRSSKPTKKLDKVVRRRGPFSMVGPNVHTRGGILPAKSKEAREEALSVIRLKKRMVRKDYNTITPSEVKSHNKERLDFMIRDALEKEKQNPKTPGSSSMRMRAASNVTLSSMKMKRGSMVADVSSQEQALMDKKVALGRLKGIEKLNFLVKGLDADVETANWRDLKDKVLVKTEKNDSRVIKALKERTKRREIMMRRHLRQPSMLHHQEDEELDDEKWLKESINAFQRQMQRKESRVKFHDDQSLRIKRASKKNRKTILKYKQLVSAETQRANEHFKTLGGGGFDTSRGSVDKEGIARKLRKSIPEQINRGTGGGRGGSNQGSRAGSPVML